MSNDSGMTTSRQREEEDQKVEKVYIKKAIDDLKTGKPVEHGKSGTHHQSRQNNVKKKFSK